MKIHSALDAGEARVVKMATVTSWDRFQAQSIWGMSVQRVSDLDRWLRSATGLVILGVGNFLTLVDVFKMHG